MGMALQATMTSVDDPIINHRRLWAATALHIIDAMGDKTLLNMSVDQKINQYTYKLQFKKDQHLLLTGIVRTHPNS